MSHRTQITLTDDQYDRLREEAAATGMGLAEIVRRALSSRYGVRSQDEIARALTESFGAWQDFPVDGARYVDSLRQGLLRRLDR